MKAPGFEHKSARLATPGKFRARVFDGIYALFCGVVLLAATAILFAPVIHRILHRFHLEDADK